MNKKINWHLSLILVLASILGFFAGIVGYSVIGLWETDIPFVGEINFADTGLDRNIFIDRPRSVIVKQDLNIRQVQDSISPSLVNIYLTKKATLPTNRAYLASEILSQGVVLTNDGWIITTSKGVSDFVSKYSAIGYQNAQYQLSDFIKDKATGLVFGKMDQAKNLPVAELGQSDNLAVGQSMVVVSEGGKIFFTKIVKIGNNFKKRSAVTQSSDELTKKILVDINLDNSFEGAVLANLKGEIVGIVSAGEVIPVDYFKSVINQILDNQSISRAKLGLSYVDLYQTKGLIDLGERGALIVARPQIKSPAYKKIIVGDIIIKVNDEEVGEYNSLSELLLKYKPGQKIDLSVLRDGQELEMSVILQ